MDKTIIQDDFLWGASTAATQIEGAYDEGGKCLSIWDVAPADKIKNGENCRITCDHYHRYKEDVQLMKEIGLKSYRFSISWCRIVPQEGKINEDGLRFYSDLVDELIRNGIEPLVTLYHWDLPIWVNEKGGWLSNTTIDDFVFYVEAVVKRLSDRVRYWITFNEPQCFLMNGYMQGVHAPFKRNYLAMPKFSKVFMRANKKAVDIIRANALKKPMVGLSYATGAFIPDIETDLSSVEQARRKSFNKGIGLMNNRWWMDPVILGKGVSAYGIYHISNKVAREVKADFDFIGINHYEAFNYAAWGGDKTIDRSKLPLSQLGWVMDGRSMYWTLKFIYERYHLPIMITENGVALDDKVIDGTVDDEKRISFMDDYLANMKKAMKEGVEVLGYNHWSLMDNFEWAEGYTPRLGLIYVDYDTLKRTKKKSAYHYKHIIESNGDEL